METCRRETSSSRYARTHARTGRVGSAHRTVHTNQVSVRVRYPSRTLPKASPGLRRLALFPRRQILSAADWGRKSSDPVEPSPFGPCPPPSNPPHCPLFPLYNINMEDRMFSGCFKTVLWTRKSCFSCVWMFICCINLFLKNSVWPFSLSWIQVAAAVPPFICSSSNATIKFK